MTRPAAVLALLCASAILGCAGLDEPGRLERPIIGGNLDSGKDYNVVLVWITNAQGSVFASCTGELISPRVVMTAAHCAIDPGNKVIFADAWNTRGGTFTGLIARRDVVMRWVHPSFHIDSFDNGFDIALLLLDSAPPDTVKPLPINRQRLIKSDLNQPLRLVGFGQNNTPNQTIFDREQTMSTLFNYTHLLIAYGDQDHNTCHGDSGGPEFMTLDGVEVITGITSGIESGCASVSAQSFATRVDTYLKEIDAFIAANDPQPPAGCGADGVCGHGCTAPDPDCPCIGDGFCTDMCANPERDPDCPENCTKDGTCQRDERCPLPDPDCGDKGTGDICGSANDCLSGFCVPKDAVKVCVPACDANGACPSGYECSQAGTPKTCLPSSGGCSVATRGGGAPWVLLLLLLMASTPRRTRR